MSCSTRPGAREVVDCLEKHHGVKISQEDWHDLREWAGTQTDVSRKKLSRAEIYDALSDYSQDLLSDVKRSSSDYIERYDKLPLYFGDPSDVDNGFDLDNMGLTRETVRQFDDNTADFVGSVEGKITEGSLYTLIMAPTDKREFASFLESLREKRKYDGAVEKYRDKSHRDDRLNSYKNGVTKDGIAGACSPSGLVAVEFVDLGEGYNGDYDPEDPEDTKLLRFDAYIKRTPSTTFNEENGLEDNDQDDYKGGWAMRENSSFCTQVPADTPKETLRAVARGIATGLDRTLEEKPHEWKHTASLFSHLSGDMWADKEVFDSTRDKSHLAVNWGSEDQAIVDAWTL
jgi:hypothetical protein